jgi:ABC-type cobalamin/Fe3+-siderophores transport system ATPase subunit
MTNTQKSSITIKVDGFKTYKGTIVIGPISGLIGIFGNNGSGKTNLIESLEFLFDFNIKNNNSNIKTIFSKLVSIKEIPYTKIGLKIKRDGLIFDFIKIVNYSNITEYFLNTKKISSRVFFYQASKLHFDKFKKITSILKVNSYDIFFDHNFVYKLVQSFSESKKTLLKTIKIGSLIQKLQENYIFYSKKINFILNEKKMLKENLKKLKTLNLKKIYLRKKYLIRSFLKINLLLTKSWKGIEKLKQKSAVFNEILLNKKDIQKLPDFKNTVYEKNKTYLENYLLRYLKKLLHLNLWILNTKKIKTFRLFTGKNFSHFVQKKYLTSEKKLKFFLVYNFNRKNFILELYNSFCLKPKILNKFEKIDKNLENGWYRQKPIYLFFTNFLKNFIDLGINMIYIRKKKINIKIFYSTYSLINLISNPKEKEIKRSKFENNGLKYSFKNISYHNNIRGNIFKIFKPLDSQYRSNLQSILKIKRLFILVDNFKTAQICFNGFKSSKNSIVQFYPIKSIEKKINKINTKSKKEIFFLFDYDEYDSFIPNLLLKLLIYNSLNLRLKFSEEIHKEIQEYVKNPTNLNNKIEENISIGSTKYLPIYCERLKNSLKGCFNRISDGIKEIKIRKNRLFIENFFSKSTTRFLYSGLKNKKNLGFVFKSGLLNIQNQNRVLFKIRVANYLKLYEYMRIKKNLVKKIISDIINSVKKKKFILFKFLEGLKNPLSEYTFESKRRFIYNLSLITVLHFLGRNFLFKKNLKTRLKYNLNYIEINQIFIFIQTFLDGKKVLKINGWKIFLGLEKFLEFQFKNVPTTKSYVKKKKKSLSKGEKLISKVSEKICLVSSFFLIESLYFLYPFPIEKKERVYVYLEKILFFLESNSKIKNSFHKNEFLKKLKTKNFKIMSIKKSILFNQFNFLRERFDNFKKNMINNRKNYLLVSMKKNQLKQISNKKFLDYFENWSKLVRIIYKNLTATYLKPLGGLIFLNYTHKHGRKLGEIHFSVVPVSQKIVKNGYLSDGEFTFATLSVFIAFNYINSPPLVILDEIDSHLDPLNFKKFIWILKKLENKKNWNMMVVTQKNDFSSYFSELIGVFRNSSGSRVHTLKC